MNKTTNTPKTTKRTAKKRQKFNALGAVYFPVAKTRSMKVETPDSMAAEMAMAHAELTAYLQANFGDMSVEEYVRRKLAYPTMQALENALFAEQIDGVALAIYNIEAKKQGIVIGDQTGIGKGRQAAAIIRYALLRGKTPIFFTEKPNLFSDIYRDLIGIGSEDGTQIKKRRNQAAEKEWDELTEEEQDNYGSQENYDNYLKQKGVRKVSTFSENKAYDLQKGTHVVPFIVNSKELKSSIKDANGNILYEAPDKAEQDAIFAAGRLPSPYRLIMLTYSQIATGNKVKYEAGVKVVEKGKKAQFIANMAEDNIIIMDEAHNASGGDSSTGIIAREMLQASEGAVFLSGTFAKRPENMALYAQKTAIGDVNSTAEGLAEAITVGGVAMQEWVSSILVKEGQMIRRERGLESTGAVVNWITLDESAQVWGLPNLKDQHRQTVDRITSVIRQIIAFQTIHVGSSLKMLNQILKNQMGEANLNQGTKAAGVDNVPYFSKVFNVINQLLFSTKAEAVALQALKRLQEGKKVVIAFSSTMGSFIDELTEGGIEDRNGGTRIKLDFALVLEKALRSVLKIQVSSGWGKTEYRQLQVEELSVQGQKEYQRILEVIRQTTTDILVSPIDVIKEMIAAKGYEVAEVTGRSKEIKFDKSPTLGRVMPKMGVVVPRAKEDAAGAFRRFQNNEVDVLLINQSGATGASAHAIPTERVPASKVKQRVMIIAQAELDVNIEVQKWGRINRTGQILPPIYDYIVSAIPAEQRPTMMLQNKLRSLFANTTSSQKSSKDILQSNDFLNKIGDRVVKEYVEVEREENGKESIYSLCDLKKWMGHGDNKELTEELAKKVAGRVAIIPTARQQIFYEEVAEAYKKEVERLVNAGEYDLEVEVLDLKARLIQEDLLVAGKPTGTSEFAKRSMLGLYEVNNLHKPYTYAKLQQLIEEATNGKEVRIHTKEMFHEASSFLTQRRDEKIAKISKDFEAEMQGLRAQLAKAKEEKAEVIRARMAEAEKEYTDQITLVTTKEDATIDLVEEVIKNFYAGRKIVSNLERLVCLGVKINQKAKNPYSLGKIYVDFAVASSVRRISFNLAKSGYSNLVQLLKAAQETYHYNTPLQRFWEEGVKELNSDRIRVYIITGNLLQAIAQEQFRNTRIVDFTMTDGSTRKGLLVPYSVLSPPVQGSTSKINKIVPFSQCADVIRNMPSGRMIGSDKLSVMSRNGYIVFVPASKVKGGDLYTDKGLLEMVENENFTKYGEKMKAVIKPDQLDAFCEYVSQKFGLSCMLNDEMLSYLKPAKSASNQKEVLRKYEPFPQMPLPAKFPSNDLELMEMEAIALELELELLAF